jgi:hypothetical protein|eukprot:SAG25_NODE_75_length_16951_cov_86.523208_10_plen_68_part_00
MKVARRKLGLATGPLAEAAPSTNEGAWWVASHPRWVWWHSEDGVGGEAHPTAGERADQSRVGSGRGR